jgi:hypothetical protein
VAEALREADVREAKVFARPRNRFIPPGVGEDELMGEKAENELEGFADISD